MKVKFTVQNICDEPWGRPIYFKLKSNYAAIEFISQTPPRELQPQEELEIEAELLALKYGQYLVEWQMMNVDLKFPHRNVKPFTIETQIHVKAPKKSPFTKNLHQSPENFHIEFPDHFVDSDSEHDGENPKYPEDIREDGVIRTLLKMEFS